VLLDLGRGRGGLAPADAVDLVGVGLGERDRGGALGRQIAERVVAAADRHQHADRPPAQVHRGDDRAGQEVVDRGAQRGDPLARNLGTDGDRDRDLRRERGRAGEPLHRRSLEVDEVDRGRRDALEALGLGDDLLSDLEGRHLVEDLGDRQRGRRDVRQLAGRPEVLLVAGLRVVTDLRADRVHELLARGEVPVRRRAGDSGGAGDLGHLGVRVVGQQIPGGLDELGAVQRAVAAPAPLAPFGVRCHRSKLKQDTASHLVGGGNRTRLVS
jgi:hypothetical protein